MKRLKSGVKKDCQRLKGTERLGRTTKRELAGQQRQKGARKWSSRTKNGTNAVESWSGSKGT